MTQKRRKADSGKAIGETTALRWEPTHVTKPNPRVVPLQMLGKSPRSKGDIRVKLDLTTQAVLYAKTNGLYTAVT